MVNLTRAALLQQSDSIARVGLIKSIDSADSVKVRPREPTDQWEPYETDRFTRAVGRANLANVRPVTMAVAKIPTMASNVTSTWP